MIDVVHICPNAHIRGTGYCGACQHPTTPHCATCGHDLTRLGHETH